jgi:hypothetical protein
VALYGCTEKVVAEASSSMAAMSAFRMFYEEAKHFRGFQKQSNLLGASGSTAAASSSGAPPSRLGWLKEKIVCVLYRNS